MIEEKVSKNVKLEYTIDHAPSQEYKLTIGLDITSIFTLQ